MNIIFNGFHEPPLFPIVTNILNYFRVDLYFSTFDSQRNLPPTADIHACFHQVKDLQECNYGIDWNEITPVGEDLLVKMSQYESTIIKMIDRIDLDNSLSYEKRKNIYLKHLRYWNHMIEEKNIKLFISSNIPHEIYDYVIYSLCKIKNIPTIFLYQIRIPNTVLILDDWENGFEILKNNFELLQNKYNNVLENKIVLEERFQKDFDLYLSLQGHIHFDVAAKKPDHKVLEILFKKFLKINISHFLILIKTPFSFVAKFFNFLKRMLMEIKIFGFYKKNQIYPDLTKKYIYLPLHLQPEATTSPMAGEFVNQILIAQMLAYNLPPDVYIYVKENPFQTIIGRNVNFYKELLNIPQLRFIPTSYDTFALLNNCIAVATATGTAGWEAVHRGKPLILFGHVYYQHVTGVALITSNEECKLAIDGIIKGTIKPNIRDVKIYSKALEEISIKGIIDSTYQAAWSMDINESNLNITEKLIEKIKQVCIL